MSLESSASNLDQHPASTSSPGDAKPVSGLTNKIFPHIRNGDTEDFESNVLAEELAKERTLIRIRSAVFARERGESNELSASYTNSPSKLSLFHSYFSGANAESPPSPSSRNSNVSYPPKGPSRSGSEDITHENTAASRTQSLETSNSLLNHTIEEVKNNDGSSTEAETTDANVDSSELSDVRQELFQAIPEPYPHSTDFQRVIITNTLDPIDRDTIDACQSLKKCMALREKWISDHPPAPQDLDPSVAASDHNVLVTLSSAQASKRATSLAHTIDFRRRQPPRYDVFNSEVPPRCNRYAFEMRDGVMIIVEADAVDSEGNNLNSATDLDTKSDSNSSGSKAKNTKASVFPVYSFDEFVSDFNTIRQAIFGGPTTSYAFKQLELLTSKFHLHVLLNGGRETEAQKSVPHRDFYNVRKVDTHVHHSACMNQKHLLRFIKHKLRHVPNEVVVFRDGKFLTLGEVFKSLHLTAYDLSIDTLDMHANDTFHRFDRFNLKYNPAGQSRLREIFLKTDNVIGGRYLAEITKEVISDLDAAKYQLVEWRVSIYGRKASEWEGLAKWFYVNRLAHMNVRWLIQIPRLFHIYRKGGELRTFGQMLHNIFAPLFAVSLDPSSNLALHYFLQTVVGIDSVDDESRPEHGQLSYGIGGIPKPDEWTEAANPPYGYWMYYLYANLCALNKLRASLGLCTFQFRPHCGEAGDIDHLISTYLVAHQINHGIQLRKNAALQYLFYLSQVGIAMSPLSNNKLFLDYNKNPFPKYFYIGMNVSLSTDDPLMLHYTKDPLVEEYSVAAQVWKLSSADQCEIARNSVLQSGWEMEFKQYFLGKTLDDIKETNVPDIRLRYRKETLDGEVESLNKFSSMTPFLGPY